MVSNKQIRQILGDEYSYLTDEEIQEIINQMYAMAYDIFEVWQKDSLQWEK
jgi:uncharacterized LabA/DUF88 family protein